MGGWDRIGENNIPATNYLEATSAAGRFSVIKKQMRNRCAVSFQLNSRRVSAREVGGREIIGKKNARRFST